MTTILYDSTTLDAVPADAQAVAGYTSGFWPTYAEVVRRWPNAKHLSIAVTAGHDADCLDVEAGDTWPADSPLVAAWVKRQAPRPVVYVSVSAVATMLNGLALRGIARADVRLWTAHYGSGEHICSPACGFGMPTTADATQWTSRALGRNLDQSLTYDAFWTPKPAPAPSPQEPTVPVASTNWFTLVSGVDVFALGCPTGGAWLLRRDGAINAVGGAPFCGAPNGQPYWGSRHAAQLEPYGRGYTVVSTTGERYNYLAP